MAKELEKITDPPPDVLGFNLRLRTLKSSKNTFAKLMRERAAGRMDDGLFRSLIWSMSVYIGFLRLETEQNINDRLDALENLLKQEGKLNDSK